MSAEPAPAKRPYVVIAVIDDESKLEAVLNALARRGHGATMFNSLGMGRLRSKPPNIPLIASIGQFFESRKDLNVTLLSVVQGENAVWDVIAAIEGEIGELDQPHRGIAFAFPLSHVSGYFRYQPGDLGV